LADMHESCGIEDCEFDVAFVKFAGPLAPIRDAEILMAKVVRWDRSVPTMMRHKWKIQHRIAARAIAGGHILHNLFVGLAYMPVGIDDASSTLAIGFLPRITLHESFLRYKSFSQCHGKFQSFKPFKPFKPSGRTSD